jgi:CRISPR-associated protein Csb2
MARMKRRQRGPQPGRSTSWVFARPSTPGTVGPTRGRGDGDDLVVAPGTASSATASVFGEWLVLLEEPGERGQRLGVPLARAEDVTRALRAALLHHAVDPPPAALSGHTPDGRRLDRPHAAFLALPDLGSRSEGTSPILGVAIVFPREIDPEEHRATLLAAARWERSGLRLLLGSLGAMQLARVDEPAAGGAFDPAAWTGPSRRWASVTPVALHHNPGKLTARDPAVAVRAARRAEEIVTCGCAHICLPRPARVRVMRRSLFPGVPSAPEFMPFPRKAAAAGSGSDRFKRVCVHAELEFAEPVEGPVLLGAGRYFGVGLCGAWRE